MFTERRSIRRYQKRDIEQNILDEILEAARWAPSWGNSQCCELIIVKNAATKKQLAEALSPKNPATLAIENAPVVVAVCAALQKAGYYNGKPMTKFDDWFMYDLGLATENICLAAHGLGLGSVIVGAFDHEKTRKILGVPDSHEIAVLLPLGYPDHQPPVPKRKAMNEFVHMEKFKTAG